MREQHQQFYPGSAASFSFRQLRIGQPFSRGGGHETIKAVQCVYFYIAVVQTEREFINIASQMLFTGMVIDAMQAAFQDGPNTLNTVGPDPVPDVLTVFMVYGSEFIEQAIKSTIDSRLIGVQRRTYINAGMDSIVQNARVDIGDRHCNGPSATLPHAEHGGFPDSAAPGLEFINLMFVNLLTAYVCFIDLDNTTEHGQFVPARLPEAMQNEPRGFLSYPDLFGELQGGNPLPGGNEQIHSIQPFVQRDMRPLKNGARANREILSAFIAPIKAVFPCGYILHPAAEWTFNSIGPQAGLQIFTGALLIREHLKKLERAHGDFVAHDYSSVFSVLGLPPSRPLSRLDAALRSDLIRPRAAAADFTGDIS
jgi:hypothetical protein